MKRVLLGSVTLLLIVLASCSQQNQPELEVQAPPECDLVLAKRWQGATLLGSSAGVAQSSNSAVGRLSPQVAVSANGNAFAVWLGFDGVSNYTVYARRYARPPLGFFPVWEPAVVIGTFGTINGARVSDSPRVAMDRNGNATVVWEHNVVTSFANATRIYARRFTPAGGWGLTTRLDTGTLAARPRIAMNENGDAVVVWEQVGASGSGVFSRRFTNGVWPAATGVRSNGALPEVAIDANGQAVAIWQEGNGIKAGRSTRFGSWVDLTTIDQPRPLPITSSSMSAKIVMTTTGHAIVTWLQDDSFNNGPAFRNVLARRFTPGTGWDVGATTIASSQAFAPQAALDANRNAVTVWRQSDALLKNNYARIFTSSGTFIPSQGATLLEFRNETPEPPVVAMSASGNGIALWAQRDGTAPSIYASHLTHFLPTIKCPERWLWGTTPVLLESSNQAAFTPQIAMYTGGNAIAVWTENIGKGMNVYVNIYR